MNEGSLFQKYMKKGERNEPSLSNLKMLIAKQAEIMSKLRDWFQETGNLRELIDEYLNLEVQLMDHGVVYDLNRLKWVKAEGPPELTSMLMKRITWTLAHTKPSTCKLSHKASYQHPPHDKEKSKNHE